MHLIPSDGVGGVDFTTPLFYAYVAYCAFLTVVACQRALSTLSAPLCVSWRLSRAATNACTNVCRRWYGWWRVWRGATPAGSADADAAVELRASLRAHGPGPSTYI